MLRIMGLEFEDRVAPAAPHRLLSLFANGAAADLAVISRIEAGCELESSGNQRQERNELGSLRIAQSREDFVPEGARASADGREARSPRTVRHNA